jgi:general secretion pathway protein L
MAHNGLITFLPLRGSGILPWWQVVDGAVVARGTADLNDSESAFPASAGEQRIMALVPASHSVTRWISMGDLAPRQAETAARLKVSSESLGGAGLLHIVAAHQDDKDVLVASMSAPLMQSGLALLARFGLNPDVILPSGLTLCEPEGGITRADIGGADTVLRGAKIIAPDEQSLRDTLFAGQIVTEINADTIESQLLDAFAAPPINLRSGTFAKKNNRARITPTQWRILAWMLCAGLLLSLLVALATYWKYDHAVVRENALALAAVRKIAPQAIDAQKAQLELDQILANKGMAGRRFTAPASALFAQIEASPGAALRDMRYSGDGILAATIEAPTIEPINNIVLELQQLGYKVTATPRQDASGLAMADLSMRVP